MLVCSRSSSIQGRDNGWGIGEFGRSEKLFSGYPGATENLTLRQGTISHALAKWPGGGEKGWRVLTSCCNRIRDALLSSNSQEFSWSHLFPDRAHVQEEIICGGRTMQLKSVLFMFKTISRQESEKGNISFLRMKKKTWIMELK